MIKYSELSNRELVYTWQNPDSGKTRMWAVERMGVWLPTSGIEVFKTDVKKDQADYFIRNRGIEPHRIQFLGHNPKKLAEPGIMIHLPGSESSDGRESDLMIDGHHRFVTLALIGMPYFRFYHLTSEQARPFEVEDVRQLSPEEMLVLEKSASGIGMKRV